METDEEVYKNAVRCCQRDIREAIMIAKTKKDKRLYLNTPTLMERVKRPWLYDRCGKYIGEPPSHVEKFFPSLLKTEVPREKNSDGKISI